MDKEIKPTQREALALMIYESDLIISGDPDIWAYCLELADRILAQLDGKLPVPGI